MADDLTGAPRRSAAANGRITSRALLEVACCRCRARLVLSEDEYTCTGCSVRFPVVDGVPVLSDLSDEAHGSDYKRRQIEFFDGEAAEFEITRPRGQPMLYGWLMAEKFRRSIRDVEWRLAGATVLTICGGSGMDAEFLARQGATVIASDLSLGAAQRAVERGRRAGLPIIGVVADAEALPFADDSIDIVYVHDGLHHLNDPMVGLSEMCRVARECVLVTEPSQAVATTFAIGLGIALREEDAGNRVERVCAERVAASLTDCGFQPIGVERYAMYYQHEPGWAMRAFSRRSTFPVARRVIVTFNRMFGSIGNKVAIRAVRRNDRTPVDAP